MITFSKFFDIFQERLSKIFPGIKVTVAKKADSLYPIVSAASICAKVIRDKTIQNWKYPEDFESTTDSVGSGYPNGKRLKRVFVKVKIKNLIQICFLLTDPVTKEFLTKNIDDIFGFPHLVRFSWSTAAKFLENSTLVEW